MKALRSLLAVTLAVVATLLVAGAPLARAQTAGTLDSSFNTAVSGGAGFVYATAVQADGKIIIGGSFNTAGGAAHTNLARLNADGSVDPTFTASANGDVRCVAVQGDGKIVLGGNFTTVNGAGRNRIARLNRDGSLESAATFHAGSGADLDVHGVAVQLDGKIVVGGAFTTINGATRNRIARLNGDGSLESTATFNPGTGMNNIVHSVAMQADGGMVIGGAFTTVNDTTRNRIARLNGDGSLDGTTFGTFGSGANSTVHSVAVLRDGRILLGGAFTMFNGTTRNRIAHLTAGGSLESTSGFNFGNGPNGIVHSVAVQADGKIVLGGAFTTVNGAARNRIARFSAGGTPESTTTFNPGTGANNTVHSVAMQADGKIVFGGAFTTVNGTACGGLARLNNDAASQTISVLTISQMLWSRSGAGPELSAVTLDLSTDAGMSWTSLSNVTRVGTSANWTRFGAPLPTSGTLRARGRTTGGQSNGSSGLVEQVVDYAIEPGNFDALNPNIYLGDVNAMAVQPDGKIIIAGGFHAVLGVPRYYIARLNVDGTLDMGFDPNPNSGVYGVAVQADGKVLLGGYFTTLQPNGAASATTRNRIARVHADGTLDASFDPNADATVTGLAVQPDGKVLLAGGFNSLKPNGAAVATRRNSIARVHADGTLDTGFDPNADYGVTAVAVQADGKVLLWGGFNSLQPNGAAVATPRTSIARVHADGTLDTGFDPNPNNDVEAVAVQADGKVLLGGRFTSFQPNGAASATARHYLARINADGTLDTGFDPHPNEWVACVAVQDDGKVLFGGAFSSLQPNGASSATTRKYMARVNADGTLPPGFTPNPDRPPDGLALQADGKVLIGGSFDILKPNAASIATARESFARLVNDPATQTLSAPSASQVLWSRGGAGPTLCAVTFELSTDGGTVWTPLGNGTRVGTSSNWELAGLSLPITTSLRARGRTTGSYYYGGSSGLIEQVTAFAFRPVVTTPTSGAVTASSAMPGGHVTSDGGPAITERGIVYAATGTNPDPLIDGAGVTKVTASGTTGVFAVPVSGLVPRTNYTFKAYATNAAGTTYTGTATFTTLNTAPTAPDGSATATTGDALTITLPFPSSDADGDAVILTGTTPDAHLTVDSTNGADVTFTPATDYAGTATLGYAVSDGFGGTANGTITVTIADNDAPQVTATPANQTLEATGPAGAVTTFSGATATDNVTASPAISYAPASGSNFPLGTTTVTIFATDAANNTGTATFTVTVHTTPTVTSPTSANVTGSGAMLGGNVTSDGAATITERGFVFSPTTMNADPLLGGAGVGQATAAGTGMGEFNLTVSGLAPHTAYTFKAYATNGVGTSYTNAAAFTTLNTAPAAPDGTATGTTGDQKTVTVSFLTTDADGDAVAITGAVAVTGLTVNGFTATSVTITPGSAFTGNASFTYTVGDGFGGSATGTITVAVTDNDAPAITPPVDGFTPLSLTVAQGGTVALPDYLAQANVSDAVGVASKTQSPSAGTMTGEGIQHVTLTAMDAAGNTTESGLDVTVLVSGTATLAQKGGLVPGAGVDARIPEGTTWGTFGMPSIAAQGQLFGWLATVRTPAVAPSVAQPRGVKAASFTGIFAQTTGAPVLQVRTSEAVRDANGDAVNGQTFKSFREPVFGGEQYAVAATVKGAKAGSDTGIWVGATDGTLREIAREGSVAPGTSVKFKAFTSVAMPAPELVFFVAKVGAPSAADLGLWSWTPAAGTQLVLRERASLDVGSGPAMVKSFAALTDVKGSAGHGRYDASARVLDVLVTFADGATAILTIGADGQVRSSVRSGGESIDGAKLVRFGVPSSAGGGLDTSVALAKLASGQLISVSPGANLGVYDRSENTVRATITGGTGLPGEFKRFLDPVAGSDETGQLVEAFIAHLGDTVRSRDTCVWAYSAALGESGAFAIEGDEASGAPGTKWKAFRSLTVREGRGLMFTATLSSGEAAVTAANDTGLWASGSDGLQHLLVREGQEVGPGQVVRSFDVLEAVAGSPGQRRAWTTGDPSGRVIFRAFFTDGTSGIVSVAVP